MDNIFTLIEKIKIESYQLFEDKNEIQFIFNSNTIDINSFESLLHHISNNCLEYLSISPEINLFASCYFTYPNKESNVENTLSKLKKLIQSETDSTSIKIILNLEDYKKYLRSMNPNLINVNIHIYYNIPFDELFNLNFIINNSLIDDSKHNIFYLYSDKETLVIKNQVLTICNDIKYLQEYIESDFPYVDHNSILDSVFQLKSKLPKILPAHYFEYDQSIKASDNQIIKFNHLKSASIITSFACSVEFSDIDNTVLCSFSTYKHDSILISNNFDITNITCEENQTPYSSFVNKTETLSRIFSFIMERDSSTKLNIIKNIIGLNITEDSKENYQLILDFSETILNSLKSNYLIYSKEKIQYWFDERRKTNDYISSKCDEITTQIDNISSIAAKALTSTGAIVIGGIIPYATSSNIDILGPILILFRWVIPIFMYFYIRNIDEQYKNTLLDFEHFKTIESDLLHEDEIKKIVGDRIDRRKSEYVTVKTITIILCIIIVVAVYYISENYATLFNNYF